MALPDQAIMRAKRLSSYLEKYLQKRNLNRKFEKQLRFFLENPSYPSLNLEILEPRSAELYSFRIDKKYRVIFVFTKSDEIEIIDVNSHYD